MERITERGLSVAESGALKQYAAQGMHIIGLGEEPLEPLTVVEAVESYLEEHRHVMANMPNADLNEEVLKLGALWGQQVCHAYNWTWAALAAYQSKEIFAVVSPDRAYYSAPFALILKHINNPERDNTIALAFNMLQNPHVPGSNPGRYLGLG